MPSGRARQFDADEALDRAMGVFWSRGYEGATLPELTAAMGINKPSLYAAFGNKEELFRKALERYRRRHLAFVGEALEQPTARGAVDKLLGGMARFLAGGGKPGGCLIVNGALACGEASDPIRRELADLRESFVSAMRGRFERAVDDGELPQGTDCAAMARYVATVINGLAVQAAGGAPAEELGRVSELAMRAWPG